MNSKFKLLVIFLCLFVMSLPFVVAQDDVDPVERNRETARIMVEEQWNGINFGLPIFRENYSRQFFFHDPSYGGRVEIGASYWHSWVREFGQAFPDRVFTIDHIVAEGDLVIVHYDFSGTHDGDPAPVFGSDMEIVPSGMAVSWSGIMMYRFDNDGKIVEEWWYWDSAYYDPDNWTRTDQ